MKIQVVDYATLGGDFDPPPEKYAIEKLVFLA